MFAVKQNLSEQKVVATSLVVSVFDVVLNLFIAIISGSSTMMSQALQGTSDLITSGALLFGVRRSAKSSDKQHPFGYGREVFFWVLMAAVGMFLGTGGLSVYIGLQQLQSPEPLQDIGFALLILSFGLLTNAFAFSKSVQKLNQLEGKKSILSRIKHSSLVEIKATFLIDLLGTLAAFSGLVALSFYALTSNARFDGIGSLIIGFSMMVGAMLLIWDVKGLIVGKSASSDVLESIKSAALGNKKVTAVLDLRTMYLGSAKLLVIIEVHLEDKLETDEIEKVIDNVKLRIQNDVPRAKIVQIEVETPDEELTKRFV